MLRRWKRSSMSTAGLWGCDVPEPKKYVIKTVVDFGQVPEDRRAVCLREFEVWLVIMDQSRKLMDGITIKWPDAFSWVDDGLHHAKVSLVLGDEKVVLAEGTMKIA